jgi:hypothetical protein
MSVAATANVASTLESAGQELHAMARDVEHEIGSVGELFEGLAGDTDTILNLAGAIIGRVENDSITSVLPKVQALGAAAKKFITERLQATTGILETVNTEVTLLGQLSGVAGGQEAIALEIKVLSVLTNIEVARLGNVGAGFQYLARELADFSKSVIEDTQELATHMKSRRVVIEETRRVLLAELPRLRTELARIEVDLGKALMEVDSSLAQLSNTPAQFRVSVEDIARQIAGVVAAIQSNDITRQQMEHVQEAFAIISNRMKQAEGQKHLLAVEQPLAYAGLSIQVYQLKSVKGTVNSWTSQIRSCISGMMRISTSDLAGLGPDVLAQERKVSLQLGKIERLERESQAYSDKIQQTRGGLSHLMQLVSEHLQRSKSIRDRLRLLAFNSIVEASHLGTQADVILAISKSIKEVSVAWSQITDQTDQNVNEILALVKHTNQVMEAFSPAANEKLREAQVQTRACLVDLRSAAEFASDQTQQMHTGSAKIQLKIAEIGKVGDRLGEAFARGDVVSAEIEQLCWQLESDVPDIKRSRDLLEAEKIFSASYSTETERDVMRAALSGKPLPVAQQATGGNTVELF